ncbi:MAG TPA: nitrous oxide reductase accessory protein NosL [Vicinamibacterales bacterium]|nr:nitrous oxide reductase accessory protein NosL [Vicinamibacterales bacterium]
MKTLLVVLGAGWLAVACATAAGGGPPAIALDRTVCHRCGMLISEPIYAAALRAPGEDAQAFDDIGCLLATAATHTGPGLRIWVHDAVSGEWIDGASATFVSAPGLRTPMGGDVVAFAHFADAEAHARTHEGAMVTTLMALLAAQGGR